MRFASLACGFGAGLRVGWDAHVNPRISNADCEASQTKADLLRRTGRRALPAWFLFEFLVRSVMTPPFSNKA